MEEIYHNFFLILNIFTNLAPPLLPTLTLGKKKKYVSSILVNLSYHSANEGAISAISTFVLPK